MTMNYAKLTWHGQHMETGHPDGITWVETPNPEGGETVSMGTLGMCNSQPGETVTHYEVPCTLWGDYCGDSAQRSNYRSLVRDYPDTFVEVRGDYWSQYLAIRVEDLTDDLNDIFTELVYNYPLYDEDDHTQLEWDEANEQWDQWAKSDILSSLSRDYGVDADTIDEDDLAVRFWQFIADGNEYPYLEDAVTIVCPGMDAFVKMVANKKVGK